MALKAVIFDLDDTLYDFASLHQEGLRAMADFGEARYDIPAQTFLQIYRMEDRRLKRELPGIAANHNRTIIMQRVLERLRLPSLVGPLDLYETYWGTLLCAMKPRPGAIELLDKLQSNGVRCAICTDMTAHIQHRKIASLGLASYFDYMVTSEEAGADKPDPRMFQLCLKKLGISAASAVCIGDSFARDVCGAHAAGIAPIWLNINRLPKPSADFTYKEIRSLEQM